MMRHALIHPVLLVGIVVWPAAAGAQDPHSKHHSATKVSTMQTPQSLATEHRELHDFLLAPRKKVANLGVRQRSWRKPWRPISGARRRLPHRRSGYFRNLPESRATAEMRAVLPMTDALERELPQMLREHDDIRAAAKRFRAEAAKAGRDEYVRFTDGLAAHAREEEEILYPAAVLVGRYVKQAAPER